LTKLISNGLEGIVLDVSSLGPGDTRLVRARLRRRLSPAATVLIDVGNGLGPVGDGGAVSSSAGGPGFVLGSSEVLISFGCVLLVLIGVCRPLSDNVRISVVARRH